MGTNTRVSGEIRINPPLNWIEIQKFPDRLISSHRGKVDPEIKLKIDEQSVNTEEGELIRRTASEVIPSWNQQYRAYHIEEHLQQIVDLYPQHTFTGYLEGVVEDMGYDGGPEMWRLTVVNGRATKFKPELVWPEEVR
jgi:hypothetical protein